MFSQLKHCVSEIRCWFRSKTVKIKAVNRDVERTSAFSRGVERTSAFSRDESNEEDIERHPWTFEVSWDVVGNVTDMVTISGHKNILIGPYRADRAVNEVLESEFQPESPLGMAIQSTREKGIKVVTGNWLVNDQPPAILFDVESAKSTFGDDDRIVRFEKEQGIEIPDNDQDSKDAVLFGYLVAEFLIEFELKRRSESAASHSSTTSPNFSVTSISQDKLRLDEMGTPNTNPGQKSSTTGEETCAVFHDWNCGVGLIFLHQWQSSVATVFTLKTSQLQGHFESEKRAFDEARALGIYHRLCIERGAALASDIFSCVSETVAEQAELILDKHPDYVILQD